MDNKELFDMFLGGQQGQNQQKQGNSNKIDADKKLDIINSKLDLLISQMKPKKMTWLIEIVKRGYYVYSGKFKPQSKTLFAIPLGDDKTVIMMTDSLELLHWYLRTYKKGDLEKNLPDRLLPLLEFLKQNGIIEETEDGYRLKLGLVR